jgi:hypothetical protein
VNPVPPTERVRLCLTKDGRIFLIGSKYAAQLAQDAGYGSGYYYLKPDQVSGRLYISKRQTE